MGEWRRSTWGEEISLEYGKALRHYSDTIGPVRVFGTNGPIGWTDNALAKGPGVILGRKGAYRGVQFSPAPFFVIDTAYYVVPKTDLDMRWIYYAVIFHNLGKIDDGSPIPSTTRAAVYRLPLKVPPITEQRAIAAVLGALDDKIDQNRRTSRALARLSQAIFRAWFVDFEPVKAKADGAKEFPSVPQDIFAAMPDAFVESEVGSIPNGWALHPLSAACSLVSGGTPKRSNSSYWRGDVPWYSVKDAPPDGQAWVISTQECISHEGLLNSAAQLIPKGATIISARGTVGKLAMAGQSMTFNQSCYGLLPVDGHSYSYLYMLMQTIVSELQQRTHGSVFDTITRATFDGQNVVVPPAEIVSTFEAVVAPFFITLLSLLRESHKLAELRDYLLPRLLDGQVRLEVAHV